MSTRTFKPAEKDSHDLFQGEKVHIFWQKYDISCIAHHVDSNKVTLYVRHVEDINHT